MRFRAFHMLGALVATEIRAARALTLPAAVMASSSASMLSGMSSTVVFMDFLNCHIRDYHENTNVMQATGLITSVNTIGERIKWAREQRGLSQAKVAKAAGVSTSTIGNLEAGLRDKPRELNAIAAALAASPAWLESGRGSWEAFDANTKRAHLGKRPYPVISAVQAGLLKEISDPYAPGDGLDIEWGDDSWSQWTFALEITGESMLPDFRPGDRVIIDPELQARPGDFVVARNTEQEATFKKYRVRGINDRGEQVFELVPLNEDFETMRSDTQHLTVIGVMVEHRKKYRRPS